MSVVSIEGKHIVLDMYDGDPIKLNDPTFVMEALRAAAMAAGATVLCSNFHTFPEEGVTGFCILSESHISVHTWPSEKFAAFDCYTCGNTDVDRAADYLIKAFGATRYETRKIERGALNPFNSDTKVRW